MQTSHILIGLATLAIILIFWTVKRYLIKRKAAKDRAVKPIPKKSESAPAAAANQRDVQPVRSESSFQTSESVQPFVEKRQPGVVDRRHHAVEAQKAEPAPVAVHEETPAAAAEAVKIAEAPKAEPAPAVVREEIPAAVTETARTAEPPKAEPAPAAARGELPADWLPEDSVLRRHYLTHLQSEREALTNPYPTDSTLRRHYDAMVKIQIDGPSIQAHEENVPTQEESRLEDLESGQSAVASLQDEIASERESSSVATYDEIQAESKAAAEDWLPEDSVLRRHYLTHLQSEREALTNPYPTDSTLRRHYETMIKMELGWQPAGTGSEEAPAPQERAVKAPASDQPEAKAPPSLAVVREVVRVPAAEHKMRIPEDSVLRRHFLSHLQYEVESELPDRPTDSVLKRHHEALVCARMAERLQQLQA